MLGRRIVVGIVERASRTIRSARIRVRSTALRKGPPGSSSSSSTVPRRAPETSAVDQNTRRRSPLASSASSRTSRVAPTLMRSAVFLSTPRYVAAAQ